jgi:6-pyruvoyltetrahydropterin/6-carboxytetrahydropterin synthase
VSKYQVIVEDHFSAAHALRHYYGKTEPLHGHNYRVQVIVEGKRLQNKVKYVTDFVALRKALRATVQRLDYGNLNEVPPFTQENPSAENLAIHIAKALGKRWKEPGVKLVSVTVWETPEAAARYMP